MHSQKEFLPLEKQNSNGMTWPVILLKFLNRTLKMPKSALTMLTKILKTLMISDLLLCIVAEKTIFCWSAHGEMKMNCGKAYIMMVPANLKYGTETKPICQRTVYGKWVLSIVNPGPGKNIWVPNGQKKTKRRTSGIFF